MRSPMRYLAERRARTEPASEPRPVRTASPATAIDVLAVFSGDVTGPAATSILESYFAPGPQPRYDTPEVQAQAQADSADPEIEP